MKKRYFTGAAAILLAVSIAGCGNGARSNGGGDIGKDEAQRIAMEDAGVNESEATRVRVSQDQEDGRKVYDVQFAQGSVDYEYEVLASNGDILTAEREETGQQVQQDATTQAAQPQTEVQTETQIQTESQTQPQTESQIQPSTQAQTNGAAPQQTSQQTAISREEAIALALERVPGATEQDLRIELDYDDGQQKYEGDIIYNQREYEFEIDANSGTFLEWSEERHD